MAIGLHKLTAGSGYAYLTRQVAAHDRDGGARTPLATYYAERGETPGRWVGRGLAGVDGLRAGDDVSAEQMQALFGYGRHPLARTIRDRLVGSDLTEQDYMAATRLGAPFKVYARDVTPFQVEVSRRVAAAEVDQWSGGEQQDVTARIRTEVAVESFRADKGRDPLNARELSSAIARLSRPRTTAIAGFDLTFSPVKSISALWAIAPKHIAAVIEQAHHDAVRDALTYLEDDVLYTREGKNGVRQVDVTGLVATAFVHRDSRAGDPDLHTHVAVANKVQTLAGKWLAIDGRLIYKARVAISETYTTSLEANLRTRLGVSFAEREGLDPTKRAIREIAGVSPDLIRRWSTRRASIVTRTRELEADFHRHHGRPPTSAESIHLAQVATLQTRDAKHEPRTLDAQRAIWAEQAAEALGGARAVSQMIRAALTHSPVATEPTFDTVWVNATAGAVLDALQQSRSTWQVWHVRAEGHRQVRSADAPPAQVEDLVTQVTARVLGTESIRVTRADDGISEPATLRRRDGASVYTVAGADVYTSRAILAAEQRIVAQAGIADRPSATKDAVCLALLEHATNGVTLNAAQVELVRAMATSGRRVQLALAPAGSGKTTAMTALASAWTGSGGTVVGFAPSAAAAAVLRDHISATTDTLAKLTWSITHDDLPNWADAIGPSSLVIIDEAALADTLTLDAAIRFITDRGGQVRLIGDQHQLSAIGAGGVLRDIADSHGAVHLTELVRFLDPAEGSASLALREGRPEALGYYLDHQRVHVGGLATIADDAFVAWVSDRARGLESLLIAPTRDLVRDLNRRAQHHRAAQGEVTGPGVHLADGTTAHAGDQVITRRNHRRIVTGRADWVKNGDQWTVDAVHNDRSLTVTHVRTGHRTHLPAPYVAEFVALGYATTIHGAQGLSVDTMHGLATGTESRQQLYTMLTRGAVANHVYLQTVGDGDPHTVIRPDHTHPPTTTDILEQILGRDGRPISATTFHRDQTDPAPRLADAAARYLDALHHAAEHLLGTRGLATLDADAEDALPGISADAAWPTLRSHLALLATTGADPAAALRAAIALREIDSADDRAAVLDWRLDDSALTPNAPLPWLPAIPAALAKHPTFGPYLTARADLTTTLAAHVAEASRSAERQPTWTLGRDVPQDVHCDVAVWRAAHGIDDDQGPDPTGPRRPHRAEALWQDALRARIGTSTSPAAAQWTLHLQALVPATIGDHYTARLADQLCAIARTGIDAHALLRTTTAAPLPDDHPAAALWWRISRHLTPATTNGLEGSPHLDPAWASDLGRRLGQDGASALRASRWWPALVAATDRALAVGLPLSDILDIAGTAHEATDIERCQALVWRLSLLTDPIPPSPDEQPEPDATQDVWIPPDQDGSSKLTPDDVRAHPSAELPALMLARSVMGVLERSDAEIEHDVARAAAWDDAPFTPPRAAQINCMAQDYYGDQLHNSWAADYLRARLRCTTPPSGAGCAPAGWTNLTDHLRRHGVTNEELLAVGLSARARTGRLIDRFRDRLTLPITDNGTIVGFVARLHPDATSGPKYLNTPTTVLFHKGDVLYGYDHIDQVTGATPVLVEGPFDALAISSASNGDFIGVAPLGTALTQSQARLLVHLHNAPIIATDNDPAGRAAAERAFWLLAQHGTAPRTIDLSVGTDPGDLLMCEGPVALKQRLSAAHPLALDLIRDAAGNADRARGQMYSSAIIAASPSETWSALTNAAASAHDVSPASFEPTLTAAARSWIQHPRLAATNAMLSQTQPHRSKAVRPAPKSTTAFSVQISSSSSLER